MALSADDFNAAMQSLHDASDWFETSSVAKAKTYVTAATRLAMWPSEGTHGGLGGESFSWPKDLIMAEKESAKEFVDANDSNGAPRRVFTDFSNFRT